MEESYVREQLSQPNLKQVSFGSKGNGITYANMMSIKKKLETAEVKGIDFTTSPNRSYPNGQFASSFIGLAQLHENEDGSKSLLGTSGMESSLNSILAGTDGIITYEKRPCRKYRTRYRTGIATNCGWQGCLYNIV